MLVVASALCLTSCNAVVGASAVVVLGGVGMLASQCYDRVQVRVIDPATGGTTCDADVTVADAEGSERGVRPCYNTALTAGHWRIIARRPGYVPATSEITIAERDGACPHYVHSVQLTMRREGEPVTNPVARSRGSDGPAAPPATTTDLESPPARVVPPPIPGVPVKAFEPVSPTPTPPSSPQAPSPPATTPGAPAPSAPAPGAPTPGTPAPNNG